MKVCGKIAVFVLLSIVCLISMVALARPASADGESWETLVWQRDVYSSGADVTSSVLESGTLYRIVAQEIWWYDNISNPNLAADAQYYSTDPSGDSWEWANHVAPANGHSFLQIDGNDQYWGPFDNGRPDGTGHTYTITATGNGTSITFRIYDWLDADPENPSNNYCHIKVSIYRVITVGGYIVDSAPSGWEIWAIGALVLGLAVTVPVVGYRRKLRF
jgi:hypothetical protein